jgi:hypothetical protein
MIFAKEFFGYDSESINNDFCGFPTGKSRNFIDEIKRERVDFGKHLMDDNRYKNLKYNDFFHSNPINFLNKSFQNESEVFIDKIGVKLETVIESYTKSIRNYHFTLTIF